MGGQSGPGGLSGPGGSGGPGYPCGPGGQCDQDDQPKRYLFRKYMAYSNRLSRKVEMSRL